MRIKSCSHSGNLHGKGARALGLLASLLVMVALFMAAPDALASKWNEAEIKAMPPYCAARYNRHQNPAQYRQWEQIYGPDFLHVHHLCDAFGYLNRVYRARTQSERSRYLNFAIGDFGYMVKNAKPTFVLMPDIYLGRAQAYAQNDKIGLALRDYHKAVELDPKMVRAYVLAADLYEKNKQGSAALQLVTEGLTRNPESIALRRLYDRLGGKQPYPVAEPAGAAETAAKPETAPAPGDTTPAPENAKPTTNDAPPATGEAAPATGESSPATAQPAIGTPGNPWCRFCPEPVK